MLFKPKTCQGCPLYNDQLETQKRKDKTSYEQARAGRGFSLPDGAGRGGVTVILESLGDNEVDDGRPVRPHAPAGSIFERVIARSPGLSRDTFRIYNTIQCQPPWNKLAGTTWESGAISHCSVHRDSFIRQAPEKGVGFKQKIILALGAVAFKTLTGLSGEYLNLTDIRGYPIDTEWGLVVGSYHPSHIIQGAQKLMGVLMLDMRMAAYWAKNGFTRKPIYYQETPGLDEARSFLQQVRDNPNLPLAFDIETPDVGKVEDLDRIFSVQFSLKPQTGIYLPWEGEYVEIAQEILALGNDKVGHNVWRFDDPVLRRVGRAVINGVVHDSYWAFHHYQPDLTIEEKDGDDVGLSSRSGLQYAASFFGMDFHWKHMKFDRQLQRMYGVADVDATQRIWSKLPAAMKALGVWKGYEKLRLGLDPVLVGMSARGIPVEESARAGLADEIKVDKQTHFDSMQKLVPDELKNIEPKGGYKRGWSAVKEKENRVRQSGSDWEWFDEDTSQWWPLKEVDTQNGRLPARIVPFKPSNDQLIRYIKFKNHPVPKKKVKDDRQIVETGEQKELVKLFRKTSDPLYGAVLDYRGCETALSRYVDKWVPGQDGRVHSSFLYVPATGQLNSVEPNAQNFIKHGSKDGVNRKYSSRLREMIRARKGYKLLECDFSGFHAKTTGFEARDADYIRLASLDLHSFVTAHFVYLQGAIKSSDLPDLKWSDQDLLLYLEDIKKKYKAVRDTKAKPAGLGYGFGMGPNKLWQMNEDTMSLKDAKQLMKLLDELFPVAREWRQKVKEQADRQGFLVSRFGFIRWFWDVFSRKKVDGKWTAHNGSDAEDAIAFLPANDAHGHMQETMIMLEYGLENEGWFMSKDQFALDVARARGMNYNDRYGLINMVHDSLLFEVEEKLLDEALEVVPRIMQRKSNVLVDSKVAPQGFSCAVEGFVGSDWQNMQKVKL